MDACIQHFCFQVLELSNIPGDRTDSSTRKEALTRTSVAVLAETSLR